jgi:hypothetical protein
MSGLSDMGFRTTGAISKRPNPYAVSQEELTG